MKTLSNKDQIWADANNRYPTDPNFIWVTMDCQHIPLKQMTTSHIFMSLKMLWNNSVPQHARIEPFKPYKVNLPKARLRYAVMNLFAELLNRPDRTKGMDGAIEKMMEHVERFYGDIKVATLQQ